MPLALQANISINDFWHDDEEYVYMRIKAYEQRINTEAWYTGLYIKLALFDTVSAMFRGKNAANKSVFPSKPYEINNLSKKNDEISLTKEELFRKRCLDWY